MIKMKHYWILLIFVLSLQACKKDEPAEPIDLGYNYFGILKLPNYSTHTHTQMHKS